MKLKEVISVLGPNTKTHKTNVKHICSYTLPEVIATTSLP